MVPDGLVLPLNAARSGPADGRIPLAFGFRAANCLLMRSRIAAVVHRYDTILVWL